MRLPRRVPWASLEELEQVCSSIFTDTSDLDSQKFAINRISAWRAITTLPHAIESTLALLVVVVQDASKDSSLSVLLLRQSYSSALIRLVNGLVDPLQVGTYARPINSIAQQLGLPGWLVELRHAATHEDLPSIDLLREAARQSMSWLLHNYYLPMLNPPIATTQKSQSIVQIRPLIPLLKGYKGTMKTMTRDVSVVTQHRAKLLSVLRDIERWIGECQVAATGLEDLGWGDRSMDDENTRETWAVERFCDGLAEKGMLVPLSKKKRIFAENYLPSASSVSSWEVLLRHTQSLHSNFPSLFCKHLIFIILSNEITSEDGQPKTDSSHNSYLACWVNWAVQTWEGMTSPSVDLRKDAISELLKGLFTSAIDSSPPNTRSAPMTLLKALTAGYEQEYETLTTLLLRPQSQYAISETWSSDDLEIMQQRHKALQQTFQNQRLSSSTLSNQENQEKPIHSGSTPLPASSNSVMSEMNIAIIEAPKQEQECMGQELELSGWRLLTSCEDSDKGNWKPCPIGVFYST
ncbi:Las1-like-domain-containing protein [Crepidotus variabilis]|uniref:Las1-like-domain-containing protein n=1 Tax=Crepidotus variabilis TaxID=179855 RepID=A0A9P6E839_9AGAR|nr:Las1-like-domain-containing protein [Crepidotus variabilis]